MHGGATLVFNALALIDRNFRILEIDVGHVEEQVADHYEVDANLTTRLDGVDYTLKGLDLRMELNEGVAEVSDELQPSHCETKILHDDPGACQPCLVPYET